MIKDCFIVKLNIGFDFKKKKLERMDFGWCAPEIFVIYVVCKKL